jgi:hypothetical protein
MRKLSEKQFTNRNNIAESILLGIANTEDFRLQAAHFLIVKENISLESYISEYVALLLIERHLKQFPIV